MEARRGGGVEVWRRGGVEAWRRGGVEGRRDGGVVAWRRRGAGPQFRSAAGGAASREVQGLSRRRTLAADPAGPRRPVRGVFVPHSASRHLLRRVLPRDAGQGRNRDRSRRRLRERVFERGRKDRSRGVVVTDGRPPDPLVDLPCVVLQQLPRGHAKACGPPTDQPQTSAVAARVCARCVMLRNDMFNSAAGVEVRNARKVTYLSVNVQMCDNLYSAAGV